MVGKELVGVEAQGAEACLGAVGAGLSDDRK